jgi:hypothetical protein
MWTTHIGTNWRNSDITLLLLLLSMGPAEFRLAHCSLSRLIVLNPVFSSPFISRGAPRQTSRETSISESRKYGREMAGQIKPYHCDFTSFVGLFNPLQSCDRGQTALLVLPLRRKACWGFFRPKNPTASAGFEPANVGTRCQHANH